MNVDVANYDTINVGDSASYTKTIAGDDVKTFAELSGDHNPLHMNDEFAASTRFGTRIAHGAISNAVISTVLGMKLPGPGALYASQEVKYRKPVFLGDTLTVRAEVVEKFTKKEGELKFVRIRTDVFNQHGELVTEGEALMTFL